MALGYSSTAHARARASAPNHQSRGAAQVKVSSRSILVADYQFCQPAFEASRTRRWSVAVDSNRARFSLSAGPSMTKRAMSQFLGSRESGGGGVPTRETAVRLCARL